MLRRAFLLLSIVLVCTPTFAVDIAAQTQWKAFLANPSAGTYESLSRTIQSCVATNCQDEDVAGSSEDWAGLYKLLALVERGNRYAMEIAFQIRPLYKNAAAPSEDIQRSIGLSASIEPTVFLELIRKYSIPYDQLRNFVGQTSTESIDS